MIERNLNNFERIFRLVFGVIFSAWALSQPSLNAIEWFVTMIAVLLILNGIFSRCYLWYILDLNSYGGKAGMCSD